MRYGKRNYLVYPGQRLVAHDGHWHLVTVPAWSSDDWINFKLYLDKPAKKNLFHIGVRNGAASKSRERQSLEQYYDGRIDWVVAQAKLYLDGALRLKDERGKPIIYVQGSGWRLHDPKDKTNGQA